MENENFIASLLLSKASVEFQDHQSLEESLSHSTPPLVQSKTPYQKIRQRAIFIRATRRQKALMFPSYLGEGA